MSVLRRLNRRNGFASRLFISGWLISLGLVVELATLFWIHPVSMSLFLCLGAVLVIAGMSLFLWSLVTTRNQRL